MLSVLIRSTSLVASNENLAEELLMSTCNICFYVEVRKLQVLFLLKKAPHLQEKLEEFHYFLVKKPALSGAMLKLFSVHVYAKIKNRKQEENVQSTFLLSRPIRPSSDLIKPEMIIVI